MTTQKFTLNTIEEVNATKNQFKEKYGEENLVFNYGTFEEFNYNITIHIFN